MGNDGNQKGSSCFSATSKGIVENNMPAYHICLASCFIHRLVGVASVEGAIGLT
jgi:hypothetical protein